MSRVSAKTMKQVSKAKAFFEWGIVQENSVLWAKEAQIDDLLNTVEEDRVATLIQLTVQIFGSNESAFLWLTRPHRLLGDQTPIAAVCDGKYDDIVSFLTPLTYGFGERSDVA